MDSTQIDWTSSVVVVIGPVTIAALIGILAWWVMRHRGGNGKPPQS